VTEQYLVLGKNGQVGARLAQLLGDSSLSASSQDIDFLQEMSPQLERFTGNKNISAVLNAAAYTKVDLAEGEGRQHAQRINAEAVGELAAWCAGRQLPLVHFSTDYVFDGSGTAPRTEDETVHPLSVYGQSKADGEKLIAASGAMYLILRTSWVYDSVGKNFLLTVLRLIKEREKLSMVADQIGAPTNAKQLAVATLLALKNALAQQPFPSGIYHLCNDGETSWHGFANAIFMLARDYESREYEADLKSGPKTIICQQIAPILTEAYPLPARRPHNSRLDTSKIRRALGIAMPGWEQGLQECFESLYAGTGLQASRIKNSPT